MRSAGRWLRLAATMVACVALGWGAYRLAGVSWDAVVNYHSAYTNPQAPTTAGGAPEAELVVLVVIDGLRLDTSREMPTLNLLRDNGADLELAAPQPTLSYPNWTTILSGAPPYMSGVVTNWHEGAAGVETLFDTARSSEATCVFVGPDDFEALFGVREKCSEVFMRKWTGDYMSATYVDAALRLTRKHEPRLLVVHLPDVDEAGHDHGGGSAEYANTAARVDADLRRLVEGLQSRSTAFVVVADHGHIDSGGHGGWEREVARVPGVVAGSGVDLSESTAALEDVAPSVAVLAGIAAPAGTVGKPIEAVAAGASKRSLEAAQARRQIDVAASAAGASRLAADRRGRLMTGLIGLAASLAAIGLVGAASWRALVAGLSGTVAYYALYDGLFFAVHRYRWSLSAFNSEDAISAWMNGRLAEAALGALVAVMIAGVVYPLLRPRPKPAAGEYLPGWLTLGPMTMLLILATLGIPVAWFLWTWGISPVWRLPDMMWAFKYDLDLIQATAVGFTALVSPAIAFACGRLHPAFRRNNS